MPRKTKEVDDKKENILHILPIKKSTKTTTKKTTTKSTKTTSKSKTSKVEPKSTASKTTTKSVSKSKTPKKADSKSTSKSTTTVKKATSKETKKTKSVSSKTSRKKTTTATKTKSRSPKKKAVTDTKTFSAEYYDLPFKYNQTMVKILAQTPTNLFIYWEISDTDRENLKKQYGEYFFEISKPVLIVYNETMDYAFEVDIDDFANSWYLKVNDSNCEYKIELGRRPIPINYDYMPQYNIEKNGPIQPIEDSYIYISSSNELESPNDHILFNKQNKIYFRNIKTNEITEKDIKDFPFMANGANEFISIYELYKNLYKEELSHNIFDLNNPSSGNLSSGSLSSRFK